MRKLILVSFGFLGWAFYEVSGGEDFVPAPAAPSAVQTAVLAPVVDEGTEISLGAVNTANLSEELKAIAQQAAAEAVAQVVLTSLAGSGSAETTQPVEPVEPFADIRAVTGSRVNMRTGPGTNFAILAQPVRGDEVTVLRDPGDGWLKLRTADGKVGWISASLVSAAN